LAAYGLVDFEIAPGGGIELHESTGRFNAEVLDVRQGGTLRMLDVVEQGACSHQCGMHVGAAVAGKIMGFELPRQTLLCRIEIERPGGEAARRAFEQCKRGVLEIVGKQDFRRRDALEYLAQQAWRHFVEYEMPRSEIDARQAENAVTGADGQQ